MCVGNLKMTGGPRRRGTWNVLYGGGGGFSRSRVPLHPRISPWLSLSSMEIYSKILWPVRTSSYSWYPYFRVFYAKPWGAQSPICLLYYQQLVPFIARVCIFPICPLTLGRATEEIRKGGVINPPSANTTYVTIPQILGFFFPSRSETRRRPAQDPPDPPKGEGDAAPRRH